MQKFINFKKRFNGDIYVIDGDFHQLVLDTMEDGAARTVSTVCFLV